MSYNKIYNPVSGRMVGVHTKLGKSILNTYINMLFIGNQDGGVGKLLSKAKGVATSAAVAVKDKATDAAVAVKDKATDAAVAVKDKAVDTAVAVKDKAVDTAVAVKDKAADAAVVVKDTAADAAVAVKDTAADAAVAVKDKAVDTAVVAKDKTTKGLLSARIPKAGVNSCPLIAEVYRACMDDEEFKLAISKYDEEKKAKKQKMLDQAKKDYEDLVKKINEQ